MKVNKLVQLLEYDKTDDQKAEDIYHGYLKEVLKQDVETNEPGFDEELTDDLIKRYKTKDWKTAYNLARRFHSNYGPAIEGQHKDWYQKNQVDIDNWITSAIMLGARPKYPFSEFDKKTKRRKERVQLPKTTKPKVEID